MHHVGVLDTGITHQPIGCHHLSWHGDAHIAISFLWITVAGTTLGTWCSAIVIIVTLIRSIWDYGYIIQILLVASSWNLGAIGCTGLGAAADSIFPLAVICISIIFWTCNFCISCEGAALTLIALCGLRLLYHIDLTHLRVHIILQWRNETRLFLATNGNQLILLLRCVK